MKNYYDETFLYKIVNRIYKFMIMQYIVHDIF